MLFLPIHSGSSPRRRPSVSSPSFLDANRTSPHQTGCSWVFIISAFLLSSPNPAHLRLNENKIRVEYLLCYCLCIYKKAGADTNWGVCLLERHSSNSTFYFWEYKVIARPTEPWTDFIFYTYRSFDRLMPVPSREISLS